MSLKSILNGMIRSRVPRRKRLQNRPRRDSRLALEPLEDRCLLSSDVVIEWNQTLLNEIRSHKTAPPPASRIMAIVQVAVFDAVNAIDGSYSPYLLQEVPKKDKNSSLVAAAAQAAHDTLVAFYPQDQSALDAQLQGDLAAVRDKGALKKGVEVGQLELINDPKNSSALPMLAQALSAVLFRLDAEEATRTAASVLIRAMQ